MRILFSTILAATLAAGSLPALAQTAPAPAKQKACKTIKKEKDCGAPDRTDCAWSKPGNPKGKCKTAPKTPSGM